jgi:signal transduction histidine kinase
MSEASGAPTARERDLRPMYMRPLNRLPTIRSKLGIVIIFAVGITVLLVYILLGYALRGSFRDRDRLELLRAAQSLASLDTPTREGRTLELPSGVMPLALSRDGTFSSTINGGDNQLPSSVRPPRFLDGKVHLGTANGYDYAAVPSFSRGRLISTFYTLRREPGGLLGAIGGTMSFLRAYWWQLLVGGALAAGTALFLARLLAIGMTRPLREMAGAAGKMARGDYTQRVHTASRDEVGELAAAFNRMSADLEHVERLRRDLVANVSHELKTPISALRAHLENLLDGVEQPNRETLQVMLQQSERLSRLVVQLLDLSRLESGDIPFQRQPVALRPLVSEVVSEVGVGSAGRVAVSQDVPAGLPPLWADPERLHQVLFNLLDNAVRFTPAGGPVSVSASRNEDRCEVRVADTGPGIPSEHLPLLFERFYRVDQARARGDGGTGIGLAIARSIVEAHGGTIWARSEVGRGSVFGFDIPLAASPDLPPPLEGPRTTSSAPRSDRIPTMTGGTE